MIFLLLRCGVRHVSVIDTVIAAASAHTVAGVVVRQKTNPYVLARTASISVTVKVPKYQ